MPCEAAGRVQPFVPIGHVQEQRDTTLLVVTNKSQTGHLEGSFVALREAVMAVLVPVVLSSAGGAAMTSLLAAVFQAGLFASGTRIWVVFFLIACLHAESSLVVPCML